MQAKEFNGRSIRSATDALVLAAGAVATAFGIAAAAHLLYGAVRLGLSFVAA